MSDSLPSDHDRDQDLARHIGDRLAHGESLDAEPPDDPLLRTLLAYRDEVRSAQPHEADLRDRLWAGIDRQTRPTADRSPQRRARIIRMYPRTAWAVAASVALVAVLAWLWLAGPAEPVLVAEAGETQATYTTTDGSTVTLRPYSRLFQFEKDAARFALEGEGYFEVTPDPERTFAVEAGAGVVRVLGTTFMLSTWGAQTEVYLVEGRVAFEQTAGGTSVVLEPGQASALLPDGTLRQPTTTPAAPYLDWLQGDLQLDQRPFYRVANELAQHYGVTLEVPPALRSETLSGTIPLDSLAQSLRDLGQVMGGRFVPAGPSTYRFERE